MVDETDFSDEERERLVEEVIVTESTVIQRIVVPHEWGAANLLASAERGALLLYSFTDMPHLLCWRLPDDADVLVEILADNDPRAREVPVVGPANEQDEQYEPVSLDEDDEDDDELADEGPSLAIWVLPDDIDEERLRYPARWGQPSPSVEAWVDGGPLLLIFDEGGRSQRTLRWEMAEDTLLSLIADDQL